MAELLIPSETPTSFSLQNQNISNYFKSRSRSTGLAYTNNGWGASTSYSGRHGYSYWISYTPKKDFKAKIYVSASGGVDDYTYLSLSIRKGNTTVEYIQGEIEDEEFHDHAHISYSKTLDIDLKANEELHISLTTPSGDNAGYSFTFSVDAVELEQDGIKYWTGRKYYVKKPDKIWLGNENNRPILAKAIYYGSEEEEPILIWTAPTT